MVLSLDDEAAWALDGQQFEPFRGKWTGIMRESVAVKHPVGQAGRARRMTSSRASSEASTPPSGPSSLIATGRFRPASPPTWSTTSWRSPSRRRRSTASPASASCTTTRANISTSRTGSDFPVCEAVAQAFQDKRLTSHIEKMFGTNLKRHLSPHRVRSRHRRLLARAAHRSRREGVHLAALSVEGSEP